MARGPDGGAYAAELDAEAEGFNRMEYELTLPRPAPEPRG